MLEGCKDVISERMGCEYSLWLGKGHGVDYPKSK